MPETSTDLPGGAGLPHDDPHEAGPGAASNGLAPSRAGSGRFTAASRDHPRADEGVGPLITRVQLDETLAQVSDVVLTVATDGSIGYVSPAVRSLLGFDQEDVLGHNLVDFLPPEDAQELLTKVARRHGHHEVGTRLLVRHADDGWREVLLFVHAGPALDAVGYRAVVLRDAKDRGHTLDALRQRLAFEDLLTRVASSFIHRPAHEVDQCIGGALADIGSFVGVDRVYVFVARDDRGILENTHEWTAADVPAEIESLRAVPRNELPEWVGTLERLEVIYIPRVADLGDQWRHEVDLIKPQGVRSVLAVPLADEGRLIGFIGFDLVGRERIWSDDYIAVLSSAAGIISQALARSDAEQRFGLAFTNAPLGMVLSGPDGRHIQVNQAYCELVGRDEAELIGVPAADLLHPDDVALLTEDHSRVVRGGLEQTSLELRVLRPDGATIWVRLHISAVRGGDHKLRYTVSHVEDITERHRQEHELRVSEERYRTLVENSPAFVTRFDRDLRLVYASPALLAQSSQVHVGSVVAQTANVFGVADDARWERSIRQVFDTGRRLDTEWEVWTDGEPQWFQTRAVPEFGEDGRVDHVLAMTTDITTLKRT
ncbi:MAG: PAS domain S-box protein, partial [Acidimicrobiales bacterium]